MKTNTFMPPVPIWWSILYLIDLAARCFIFIYSAGKIFASVDTGAGFVGASIMVVCYFLLCFYPERHVGKHHWTHHFYWTIPFIVVGSIAGFIFAMMKLSTIIGVVPAFIVGGYVYVGCPGLKSLYRAIFK